MLLTTGLYTYAAYRAVPVAVVVFLLATALSHDRSVLRERFSVLRAAGVVAVIVAAPLVYFAWTHPQVYFRRFADVSLTKYMVYHATPVPWLHQIGKALLAFNQRGDENNPQAAPFLDSITGALFLFGMVTRATAEQRRGKRLLWAWFVSFLALATLTKDSPHLTRMLGLAPPIALFAGLGATRLFARLRTSGAARAAVVAAIVLATGAILLNVYQYFIVQPNLPDTDLKMNLKARRLCETFRRTAPVRFLWTQDLDYWCAAQCRFLVPSDVSRAEIVNAADLADGEALRSIRPLLLAVGGEFVDLERATLPHDPNGEPRLDLPVRPRLYLDREARRMYYLYDLPR